MGKRLLGLRETAGSTGAAPGAAAAAYGVPHDELDGAGDLAPGGPLHVGEEAHREDVADAAGHTARGD